MAPVAVKHRLIHQQDDIDFCSCGEWQGPARPWAHAMDKFADHLHAAHMASFDFDERETEAQEQLIRGRMPCRFCGIEWLQDGGLRHDPLRMAGVHTLAGGMRHSNRYLAVGWGRLMQLLLRT